MLLDYQAATNRHGRNAGSRAVMSDLPVLVVGKRPGLDVACRIPRVSPYCRAVSDHIH